MVTVAYDPRLKRTIHKIQDLHLKKRLKKQIARMVADPCIGKPIRFNRKNTRKGYIPPFRLSYCRIEEQELLIFLDLYPADEQ